MSDQQQKLYGTLEKVIYKNVETGYGVFLLKLTALESVTITGALCDVHEGERLELVGSWLFHKKFGKQFSVLSYSKTLPVGVVGIQRYLSSGLIKGIGPKYAEKMVAHFGVKTLEIIDQEPERLVEVEGIGRQRAEAITQAWQTQKEISRVMVFLQEKGVSTAFAAKMYKLYKNETIEKITQNPYRLVEEVWGIGFKTADDLALKLGLVADSLYRIKAGLIYAISKGNEEGNVYVPVEVVKATALELLGLNEVEHASRLKLALHELFEQKKIILISFEQEHLLTLPSFYYSEKGIAEKIKKLKTYDPLSGLDLSFAYQSMQTTSDDQLALHEQQQRGILSALQDKISIITGGPGTGKTTLVKKLLSLLDHFKITYRLAAPTGRAAKRMFEGTQRKTETIHRLLEFNPQMMQFSRNEQNGLEGDFFIIDEASMIDIFLMHSLLKAMPPKAHILFLGDIDQLPSVGSGNVLNDLIDSKVIAVTRLTEIFRQAAGSAIIVNAHRINKGEFPSSFIEGCRRDFSFVKQETPEEFFPFLKQCIEEKINRSSTYSLHDLAVLVPMNRGLVGTQRLNQEMQNLINPQKDGLPTITRFGTEYRLNDRVMQIKNNYDKFVFNGDIGIITNINLSEQELTITFGDKPVLYEYQELNELTLAYALSIHKSQGSEFPVVIIPIFMQHFMLLQRNLIYTAVTRAQKLCIVAGQTRALAMAIKNKKVVDRKTLLQQFLTTDLQAR